MSTKVRVVLKHSGFRKLRTSLAAQKIVRAEAAKIAAKAGEDFGVGSPVVPKNRARAVVSANTVRAERRNARDNTLLRALGGSL